MRGVISPPVAARVLRHHMHHFRERAGKSQAEAGNRIGRTQSAISQIEKGTSLPTQSNMEVLLHFYGVPEQFPMMRDLLTITRSRNGDTTPLVTSLVADFTLMVGLEPFAARIEIYEPLVVPGLLQTETYARALTEHYAARTPGVDIENTVQLRLERQAAITRDDEPADLWCFVEDSALQRPVGGNDVMAEQLDHLLQMSERPNVTVQVLPLTIGPHSALFGAFQLMSLTGGLRVAYEETLRAAYYDNASDATDEYSRVVDHLRTEALPPAESRSAIEGMRKALR